MRIKYIFRKQLVIAVGGALLLAVGGAARAQEIDNPTFAEPNSVPFSQPSPARTGSELNPIEPRPPAIIAVAKVPSANQIPTKARLTAGATLGEAWTLITMAVCMVLALLRLRRDTRHSKSNPAAS